jgi:twitching motility protein PilT
MLSDLVFSDLFVAESAQTSWFKATPDSLQAHSIPPDCEQDFLCLRRHLEAHQSVGSAFKIDWPDATGERLRIERILVAEEKTVYVCRRYRLLPDTLASLGMPTAVAAKLLSSELHEGLVVFLGKAGSGKTTTAASFIKERLTHFGGVCWTIENPIELPLQGKHGKGWCYQTEASSDDDIGPAVRHMLRTSPNIIFIGEIRDSLAVREAIAAATSGHLVVATFHAADLVSGLARLSRLAGDDNASAAIADGLRVGVHLSLYNAEPGTILPAGAFSVPGTKGTGSPPRVLSVEPLWMSGQAIEGLRSIVRDGNFHLLKSEVERQRRNFLMGKLP